MTRALGGNGALAKTAKDFTQGSAYGFLFNKYLGTEGPLKKKFSVIFKCKS